MTEFLELRLERGEPVIQRVLEGIYFVHHPQ